MNTTRYRALCSIVMALAAGCVAVRASTNYVWKEAPNPQSPFTSWDTAAPDIQSALDAAGDAALVLVTNGTYTLTQELMITNALTLRSTGGRDHTMIVGGAEPNRSRCIYVDGVNARIEGFTITNGYVAAHGGGVFLNGGGTLADCTIIGNVAFGDDKRGGGVYLNAGGMVTNCLISGNRGGDGGGAFANNGGLITTSVITNNTAVRSGGGVYLGSAGTALVDSSILDNSSAANDYRWGGGGVYISGTSWASNCVIAGNYASRRGGGAMIYRPTVGASVHGLVDCVVSNNVSGNHGGGVMLTALASPVVLAQRGTLRRCRIVNNRAQHHGGGVHGSTVGSEIIVENCLIANNEATGSVSSSGGYYGGGRLLNTTIAGNHAHNVGFVGGIHCTANTILTNSIVALNTSSDPLYPNYRDEGLATWSHSLTPTAVAGTAMVVGDPRFVDAEGGNYRLRASSPAIDAGTLAVPYSSDIAGQPHVAFSGAGFANPDIGCYERPWPRGTTMFIR